MLQWCIGPGVVGTARRARQQPVERHAPQPFDGGRHGGRLVAHDDQRRQSVETRRIDVG
jgi:hypothetical protein